MQPLVCLRLLASDRRVLVFADQARRLAAAGAAELLDPLPSPGARKVHECNFPGQAVPVAGTPRGDSLEFGI
jgi:hypothetical protein